MVKHLKLTERFITLLRIFKYRKRGDLKQH
nr:MAG TPA: hypothetical protein [Caudoviricetes sp.]